MKRYLSIILVILLGFTGVAYAKKTTVVTTTTTTTEEDGAAAGSSQSAGIESHANLLPWYVGVQLGQSSADIPNNILYQGTSGGITSSLNVSNSSKGGLSYRIFLGRDIFTKNNNNIAVELGYFQFGKVKYGANYADLTPYPQTGTVDVNTNITGFDLLGVWRYMFKSDFSVLAKLGAASVTQSSQSDSSNTAVLESQSISVSKILPEIVLGAGYQFSPSLGIQFNVAQMMGDSLPTTVTDLNKITQIPSFTIYSLGLTYAFG